MLKTLRKLPKPLPLLQLPLQRRPLPNPPQLRPQVPFLRVARPSPEHLDLREVSGEIVVALDVAAVPVAPAMVVPVVKVNPSRSPAKT